MRSSTGCLRHAQFTRFRDVPAMGSASTCWRGTGGSLNTAHAYAYLCTHEYLYKRKCFNKVKHYVKILQEVEDSLTRLRLVIRRPARPGNTKLDHRCIAAVKIRRQLVGVD